MPAAGGAGGDTQPASIPAALDARPLAADLLSLRELQASLALEETDTAVVRVGTNAIVEILAIDCGLALVEGGPGGAPIRFGWLQGRAMTAAEMDSLEQALGHEMSAAREGGAASRLLADAPLPAPGAPALPAGARALGFRAALVLGLAHGGRRTGTLVLAARDPEAFSGEQAILAEILGGQMAEHCGRVRLAARSLLLVPDVPSPEPEALTPAAASPARSPRPGPAPAASDTPEPAITAGGDRARPDVRLRALEAQAEVAAAVSLSHDAERQVMTALRKAMELTGHAAGAIYLVETNDACDEILRLDQGVGDPGWLEIARLPRWRQGEGLPGRVWATGEGMRFASLEEDPAGIGRDILRRAGYRRMCCEPLKARGRVVGVIEMFGDREGVYGAEETTLTQAIANQVGVAIHNARLVADLMRHGLDLEWQVERLAAEGRRAIEGRLALEGALAAAAAEPSPEARAAAVLGRLLEMTGGDNGAVHEIEPGTGRFLMLAQKRLPGEVLDDLYRRPADDAVFASAPASGGAAVVDLAAEEFLQPGWPRRMGVRHVALVPCRSGGETRGILMLGCRYAGSFGEGVRDLLDSAAALMGLVIECGAATRAVDAGARREAEAADAGAPAGDAPRAPSISKDAVPAGAGVPAGTAPRAVTSSEAMQAADSGMLIQAQKTASIGRLAAGFEREFNNTIGAIMGHASHIRALVPDHNPVHDKAAVIEEQSYRVADLVRRLLTFSRGGIGRREPLDINTLVEETVALLSRTLDPSIVIETRCGAGLPPIEADAGEMRQVLLNLAVNARDALPDGGRVVFETRVGHLDAGAVAALPGLTPGDYVALVVSDNGVGMPEEVLDHAFEPFYTTKPITQGNGLGLTVAQDIIRDHGGHIALSSAPGIGTAARLYLPVAGEAQHAAPSSGPARAATAAAAPAGEPAAAAAALTEAHAPRTAGRPLAPGPAEPAPVAAADATSAAAAAATGEERPDTGEPAPPDVDAMARGVVTAEFPSVMVDAAQATTRDMTPPIDGAPPRDGEMPVDEPSSRDGAEPESAGSAPAHAAPMPDTPPWLRTCPLNESARGRILVVDDEAVLRDMMAEMLKSRGYEVLTARDGVEALEIYRQEWGRIDLVVCDLIMPRLGGLETFRRIAGMDRKARVLLCSGSTHHRQAQQALQEGAIGLLPKPFGMSELLGWIEKGIKGQA